MIIDLSVQLNEDTPVYPGDPSLTINTAATFETENNLGHQITLGTHAGTHIDAPAHMIQGDKLLDSYPANTFVGLARLVNVADNPFTLETFQQARIGEGDIVIIHTGMSQKFHESDYFVNYPVLSEGIAQFLVEKKVKMVGIDTCSFDKLPEFPIHKLLLSKDILLIENLTNTDQLENVEAKIYALPIRFNLDGAPARVIAEIVS